MLSVEHFLFLRIYGLLNLRAHARISLFFFSLCIQADVDSQVIGRKDMSKSAIDIWKEV